MSNQQSDEPKRTRTDFGLHRLVVIEIGNRNSTRSGHDSNTARRKGSADYSTAPVAQFDQISPFNSVESFQHSAFLRSRGAEARQSMPLQLSMGLDRHQFS